MRQYKNTDIGQKKIKSIRGVIRSEVRLMKPKAIRTYTDAEDIAGQIGELAGNSQDIFMDTFIRIIPFGDFYKKDKEDEIVREEVSDSIMRRRMLGFLALTLEKKSVHPAQKAMNCRNIEKVMDAFAKINLSPVAISRRQDVKYMENLYAYLLDAE